MTKQPQTQNAQKKVAKLPQRQRQRNTMSSKTCETSAPAHRCKGYAAITLLNVP